MNLAEIALLWAANNVGVWGAVALCAAIERTFAIPKLQPSASQMDASRWWACLGDMIANQLLLLPLLLLPLSQIDLPAATFSADALPPLLLQVLFAMFVNDTLYYWTHRLFHLPGLYALFHKRHHAFTAPSGIAAVYMTPVEFAVNQVLPATAAICAARLPFAMAVIYYGISGFGGTMDHSGYWFAAHHDDHHRLFNVNYGTTGSLWDRLCGTAASQRAAPKDAQNAPTLATDHRDE